MEAKNLTEKMKNIDPMTEEGRNALMNAPIQTTPQKLGEHYKRAMTADDEGGMGETPSIVSEKHPSHRTLFPEENPEDNGKKKKGGFLEFFGLAGGRRRRRRKKSRKSKKNSKSKRGGRRRRKSRKSKRKSKKRKSRKRSRRRRR